MLKCLLLHFRFHQAGIIKIILSRTFILIWPKVFASFSSISSDISGYKSLALHFFSFSLRKRIFLNDLTHTNYIVYNCAQNECNQVILIITFSKEICYVYRLDINVSSTSSTLIRWIRSPSDSLRFHSIRIWGCTHMQTGNSDNLEAF